MKLTPYVQGLAAGLVLGAAATGLAAMGSYHYTGVVKEVSPTKLDVDKGGEVWDFALDEATKGAGDVKRGDKVTVTYRMIATKIEKR
jgi:hypothetical protein